MVPTLRVEKRVAYKEGAGKQLLLYMSLHEAIGEYGKDRVADAILPLSFSLTVQARPGW